MSSRRAALGLIACLAAALPCAAEDTLPATAVLRLGKPNGKDADDGHTQRVSAVAFSPDGKLIATGSWDKTVRLWDAATGKELHRMPGHTDAVFTVAFAPDGKLLASASRDKSVRLWDPAAGKPVRQLDGHTFDVWGAAFAPDGKTLASGGDDYVPRLWDVATGKELRKFEGLRSRVTTVLFSRDGKRLVTANQGGQIVVWDVATGKVVREFVGHKGWVYPLALSPDGRTLASGSFDDTIRLWEMATGKQRRQVEGQRDVFALAVAPDGRTLASASAKGNEVCLWETATLEPLGTLKGHGGLIFRLAYSPDGKRLVSGSDDHTALVWDAVRKAKEPAEPLALKPEDLERSWGALAGNDAEPAYSAVTRLAAAPRQAVPFLAKQMAPEKLRELPSVARLVADLDSDSFDVREKAAKELEKVGGRAAPELRRALKDSPSAELRRRAEELLQKLGPDGFTADELRLLRVVEVLEGIGTPEARKLLEELAKASPSTEAGEEAKASLGRLKGR